MKIPNYDVKDDFSSNYKQKVSFMPDRCFRMLICAPSGGGKTNLLLDMIYRRIFVLIEVRMRESLCGKKKWRTRRIVRARVAVRPL